MKYKRKLKKKFIQKYNHTPVFVDFPEELNELINEYVQDALKKERTKS